MFNRSSRVLVHDRIRIFARFIHTSHRLEAMPMHVDPESVILVAKIVLNIYMTVAEPVAVLWISLADPALASHVSKEP